MSTFKRFEEIRAWQKAPEITKKLYSMSNKKNFVKDFSLRDQMKRASVSIMANIADGHEKTHDYRVCKLSQYPRRFSRN